MVRGSCGLTLICEQKISDDPLIRVIYALFVLRKLLCLAEPLLRIGGPSALGAGVSRLSDDLLKQIEVIAQLSFRPVAEFLRGNLGFYRLCICHFLPLRHGENLGGCFWVLRVSVVDLRLALGFVSTVAYSSLA